MGLAVVTPHSGKSFVLLPPQTPGVRTLYATAQETKPLRHKETRPTKSAELLNNRTTITGYIIRDWSGGMRGADELNIELILDRHKLNMGLI